MSGAIVIGIAVMAGTLFLVAFQRLKRGDWLVGTIDAKLSRGDVEAARVHLAELSRMRIARHAATARLQALSQLHERELQGALTTLDTHLSSRWSWFQLALDRSGAHALRAMLRAASGDESGASDDIRVVSRSADKATAQDLARIGLARAIVAARDGDRGGLRDVLDAERDRLLAGAVGAELMLVRALETMSLGVGAAPYRAAGVQAEPPWVAVLVPGSVSFLEPAPTMPPIHLVEPSEAAQRAVRDAHTRTAHPPRRWAPWLRFVGLWLGLVFAFLAVWALLAPGRDGTRSPAWLVTLVVVAFLGGVLALVGREVAKPLREQRCLREALRQANLGQHAKARQALEPLVDARQHLIAAQAATRLAELEYQRGDVSAALSHAEHALALDRVGAAVGHDRSSRATAVGREPSTRDRPGRVAPG